jgi:hypothetical protein
MQSSSFRCDQIHKCLRYDFSHTSLWYISHTWMFNQVTSGFWTLFVEQRLKPSCNLDVAKFVTIGYMRFVIRSKCHYEKKQMCRCDCGSDILIGIICPAYRLAFLSYVYVNLLIFVLMILPSFSYALPLTHTLSVSPLSSSLSPPLCLHKNPWQTFLCYHWSQ